MSARTNMIHRWANWALERDRPYYARVQRGIIDGRGLLYAPTSIDYTGGNGPAAHIIRTNEHAKGPLVRLALPNQITYLRFQDIYRTIHNMGHPVLVVPRGVLENADIRVNSIDVLHTDRRRRFARPPQQLIRANVHPRWERHGRTALFLSGYDLNERGLSYFFCELPPDAKPTTVEEAYQSLQPESVKRALSQRRKVLRQGDVFFIRARNEKPPLVTFEKTYLFESNHQVTEGGFSDDGLFMVRGKVRHVPTARRADHRTLRLPRGWWIAVRNTVPVVRK